MTLPSAVCVEFQRRFFCDHGRSNPEFGISAHLCVQLRLILHFEVGVSVSTDFQYIGLSVRGLENIQSLKESSLRRCPSFDDCHLKVVFASVTISFNFSVLSVLNGGDAQKVNPSSDSRMNLKPSLASLKKVVWSCHKHPLGVKLNSVSSAPFSI